MPNARQKLEELRDALTDVIGAMTQVPLDGKIKDLIYEASKAGSKASRTIEWTHGKIHKETRKCIHDSTRRKLFYQGASLILSTCRALRYGVGDGGPLDEDLRLELSRLINDELRKPHRCDGSRPADGTMNGQFGLMANLLHSFYRSVCCSRGC